MRILVAQGDLNVANKIKYSLLAEGFEVDIATDGETALWYAYEGNHSAIILDILFSSTRLKPSPFRRTDLSQMIYSINGLSLWQSYSLQY